jgi:hypothetical protein
LCRFPYSNCLPTNLIGIFPLCPILHSTNLVFHQNHKFTSFLLLFSRRGGLIMYFIH